MVRPLAPSSSNAQAVWIETANTGPERPSLSAIRAAHMRAAIPRHTACETELQTDRTGHALVARWRFSPPRLRQASNLTEAGVPLVQHEGNSRPASVRCSKHHPDVTMTMATRLHAPVRREKGSRTPW